jgi:hypothetical protein
MMLFFVRIQCLLISLVAIHAQQYVIKRDFHASYQYNAFTVSTYDERDIIYRIETQYSLAYAGTLKRLLPINDFIIVATIDAFLGSDQIFHFRILDNRSGRWINGRIYQRTQIIYVIELSPFQQLIIESTLSWTSNMLPISNVRFRDGQSNWKIYADYFQRTAWLTIYDLRLFSNEYPLELYLIGLAIVQRRS